MYCPTTTPQAKDRDLTSMKKHLSPLEQMISSNPRHPPPPPGLYIFTLLFEVLIKSPLIQGMCNGQMRSKLHLFKFASRWGNTLIGALLVYTIIIVTALIL